MNFIDYWKKFKNVNFFCSIDDYGKKLEYIRQGANHQKVWNNFETIAKEGFHMHLMIVVSIYNIYTLSEFFEWIDRQGYWKYIQDVTLLYAFGDEVPPGILPEFAKAELIDKLRYDTSTDFMKRLFSAYPRLENEFNGLFHFVRRTIDTNNFSSWLHRMRRLDKIYNKRFQDVFPWLASVEKRYSGGNYD